MDMQAFIEKYGTHTPGMLLERAANAAEDSDPQVAQLIRELARDLTEALLA